MKLFWRFVILIYTGFKLAGIKLKPYSFLFNKPKINFHETIQETIHAGTDFNQHERELILEACDDMFRFTNGRIKFNILFDLDYYDKESFINNCVMAKALSEDEHIQKADEKYENNVIGLCYFRDNGTKSIYLVTDRLSRSDNLFRTTAIHEFGHYLGMKHTKGISLMQALNPNNILYPTYIDAVELANIWKCLPTDFKYFKL